MSLSSAAVLRPQPISTRLKTGLKTQMAQQMRNHSARWPGWQEIISTVQMTQMKPPGFPLLALNSQPDSARQAVWIGHSTVLVSIDGVNVLTDPVFSDCASPVSFAGAKTGGSASVNLA